jgi:hypothetical protein
MGGLYRSRLFEELRVRQIIDDYFESRIDHKEFCRLTNIPHDDVNCICYKIEATIKERRRVRYADIVFWLKVCYDKL